MAFQLPKGAEDDLVAQTDINITPFIDVMLVLLIIFMVAAPLSTVDTPVSLPQAAGAPAERPAERIMVSLALGGEVTVDGALVARPVLAAHLAQLAAKGPETPVYLSADQGVSYGDLMGLMALLSEAKFLKIGLVGLETVPAAPAAP